MHVAHTWEILAILVSFSLPLDRVPVKSSFEKKKHAISALFIKLLFINEIEEKKKGKLLDEQFNGKETEGRKFNQVFQEAYWARKNTDMVFYIMIEQ